VVLDSIDSLHRSERVTDAILSQLRDLLDSGELEPGEKLPSEKDLADAFGVGRSTIRESLQFLEQMGLIETRHGVGRFVTEEVEIISGGLNWVQDLRVSSAMNLLEARETVEVDCARYAAERAGAEDVEALEQLLATIRDSSCIRSAFEAEMDFHLRLAESCGNPVMSNLVRMLFATLRLQVRDFEETMPFTRERIIELFSDVVQALRERDPGRAARAMREHFAVTKESFELLVSAQGEECGCPGAG